MQQFTLKTEEGKETFFLLFNLPKADTSQIYLYFSFGFFFFF